MKSLLPLATLLLLPSLVGFAAEPKPQESDLPVISQKERVKLSKSNPCFKWHFKNREQYQKTMNSVVKASNKKAPCHEFIDAYKKSVPPIPGSCKTLKLKDQPALFTNDLKATAVSWNSRGWNQWVPQPDNTLEAELKQSVEILTSDLFASCSTPVNQ